MTFRIAVVQPISHRPGEDEGNVADAVRTVERAAGEGADFVCFPETYPGPWRIPATFDPTAALAEAAADVYKRQISMTSRWRLSMIASQCTPSTGILMVGAVIEPSGNS